MTTSNENLAKALRLIEAAEASLKSARALLSGAEEAASIESPKVDLSHTSAYESGDTTIVEGVFDGQKMIGPNDKEYPVAPNYASKSKLVEGDRLKLTIQPNGSFLFKQIAPVEREFIKGVLVNEDGHYKVNAKGRIYRVLLASVTYYKGTAGDEVTLIVPKGGDSTWAAIEAILPQVLMGNYNAKESF
jgi:hypothetical protein